MWPIAVSVGPMYLSSFGVFLALGFLVASFLLYRGVRNDMTTSPETIFDASTTATIGAIVGARIWYIIFHPADFGDSTVLYFLFRERPGLSFAGGFLGGVLFLFTFARLRNLSFWHLLDVGTIPFLFAYLFGQIGSLLDGFSYGRVTHLPWSIPLFGSHERFHPLPLYQIIFTLCLLLLVRIHYTKVLKFKPGNRFLLLLLVLFFYTAILDFLRNDLTFISSLPLEQTMSFSFAIAFLLLSYTRTRSLWADIKLALAFMTQIRHNVVAVFSPTDKKPS